MFRFVLRAMKEFCVEAVESCRMGLHGNNQRGRGSFGLLLGFTLSLGTLMQSFQRNPGKPAHVSTNKNKKGTEMHDWLFRTLFKGGSSHCHTGKDD